MQKKTAVRFITEITVHFRYAYKDMSDGEIRLMAERWYDCLKDYTDEQAEAAFKIALCNLTRPPTIADIIGNIRKQSRLYEKNDTELWTELLAAADILDRQKQYSFGVRWRYDVRGEEEFAVYKKLSPPIRAYFDFNAFCDIAAMDADERKYERARFLKALPEIRESLNDRKLLGIGANEFKLLTGNREDNDK